MKNRLLILVTTLLLVSCWDKKTNTQQSEEREDSVECTENVQFVKDSIILKKKLSDGEYPKYTIEIKVEYAKGDSKAAQNINSQLASLLFGLNNLPLKEAQKHFTDSLSENFEKELKEFYEPDNEYQDIFAYEYSQKGTVSAESLEGVIAYTSRIETYMGGAHGGALESYLNFHKDTGLKITAEELFGKNLDTVTKMVKEQIVKDNNCKSAAELEEKRSIFSLGDVYISDNNFQLRDNGILFCFNPYDIAPWSEGFIFTILTYQQLDGLINPITKITK